MRIKIISAFWLAGICYYLMFSGNNCAYPTEGHDIPNPTQLLPQLLQGWEQLREWDEMEKEYQVDASFKNDSTKSPEEMLGLYQIRIKHLNWLLKGLHRTNGPGATIYCQCPYYTFVLSNTTAEDKQGWVLGNWDKIDSQSSFQQDFFQATKSDLFYPLTSFGSSLLHLITKKGTFSVAGVRPGENGKLIVDFSYPVKGRKGGERKVSGQMLVDPNRSYVVLESRRVSPFVPDLEFVVRREIEESPEAPGGFRCKSYDFRAVNVSTKEVRQRFHHDYRNYSYGPIPDEVFRLSYYGLPEPLDAPPVNTSHKMLWLWILLTAAALAVAAVGLRKLARRMQQSGG